MSVEFGMKEKDFNKLADKNKKPKDLIKALMKTPGDTSALKLLNS